MRIPKSKFPKAFIKDPVGVKSSVFRWQQIARVGTWNGYTMTEEWFDKLIQSFNFRNSPAPVTLGHQPDGVEEWPAYGWILGLWREKDILWGLMEMSQTLSNRIRQKQNIFPSIEVRLSKKENELPFFWAVAAVNVPAVDGLQKLAASKDGESDQTEIIRFSYSTQLELEDEYQMDPMLQQILELVSKAKGVEVMPEELLAVLEEMLAPKEEADPATEQAKKENVEAKLAALETQIAQLQKEKEELSLELSKVSDEKLEQEIDAHIAAGYVPSDKKAVALKLAKLDMEAYRETWVSGKTPKSNGAPKKFEVARGNTDSKDFKAADILAEFFRKN